MKLKTLFLIGISIVAGVTAQASEVSSPKTLDQLLRQVTEGTASEYQRNEQREAVFNAKKAEQQKLLARRKAVRRGLEKRSAALEAEFGINEEEIGRLEKRLRARLGNLGELFGVVRQVAGDTAAMLSASLVSAQHSGRVEPLLELAQSKKLPSTKELTGLWFALQHEMTESGKVVRFKTDIVLPSGQRVEREVVRVGVFNAISNGQYLNWDSDRGFLTELARQPERRHVRSAEALSTAQAGVIPFSIDPSRGALLGLLVQRSTWSERITHGGTIGYAIIALACIGLLLVAERLVHLMTVGRKIDEQCTQTKPDTANPLGRVLAVYETNKDVEIETLELRLDEAIQKETPKLERFLTTIRVLAVMAPLMGLLGTVTGMIIVFQDITLFGSGDPKIMAGGISQALVTTVLGLVAALPLILSHSLLLGRAKSLVAILDEQSTGIVAARAESRA